MTRREGHTALLDAVMTQVAAGPRPTPARAFAEAARRGHPRDALAALATAWRLATLRSMRVPVRTRVQAAALALGVGGAMAMSGAVALASVANVAQQAVLHFAAPVRTAPASPGPTPGAPAPPTARPVVVLLPPDAREDVPPHPRPAASSATSAVRPSPTAAPTTSAVVSADPAKSGEDQPGTNPTPRPSATPTPSSRDGGGDGGDASSAPATSDSPADGPAPTPSPATGDGGSDSGDGASSGG